MEIIIGIIVVFFILGFFLDIVALIFKGILSLFPEEIRENILFVLNLIWFVCLVFTGGYIGYWCWNVLGAIIGVVIAFFLFIGISQAESID